MDRYGLYTIKDNASGVFHFDYVNHKYYAVLYEESKRTGDSVAEEHVTWREILTDDNFELYMEEDNVVAYLEGGRYHFVTQRLYFLRDLDVEGLQGVLEDEYLNVQVSLDQTKLTIVFTPNDRMGWDCRDFRSYIYRYTTEKVSVSDVHSRFDSDCNEHFVYLTFDLGGQQ